jgi:predicted transposase YbfD/YdcC
MKKIESPIHYFANLKDYRDERYTTHKLINIVAISICAIICGASDWYEVEDYGKKKTLWLQTFLALDGKVPSHDTYNRFFSCIDSVALEQCFADWIAAVVNITKGSIISIDGKTLRGSKGSGQDHFIHMVSAWCNTNGMVLGQQKVDDKSNEITAIPALLELLVIKGCFITIDAMGCQIAIAEKITEKEADYILAVKDNQKFLHQDIQEAFENEKPKDQYTASNIEHGRIETRTTSVITNLDWICKAENWKGLQCIVRVQSSREDKKTSIKETATRYYISSKAESAQFFQHAIRSHWSIENKLHWMLDVTFKEDDSKKQAGSSAQNFSLFNKIALNMINHHCLDNNRGAKKISAKRKRKMAAWDDDYLVEILLSFNPD